MTEDILGLGKGFDVLRETLGLLKYVYEETKKYRGQKRKQRMEFVETASKALRQTLSYIRRIPYTRDEEKEAELSELWAKVASLARPFNEDLAQRCYLKGNYWANPERWSDEQLDSAKIEISVMEKEIGKLFGGKKRGNNK